MTEAINEDLRVEIALSASLPIKGIDFTSVKPSITLLNIDPRGDIDEQVATGIAAAEKAMEAASDFIETQLEEAAPLKVIVSMQEQITELTNKLGLSIKHINRLNTKVGKLEKGIGV